MYLKLFIFGFLSLSFSLFATDGLKANLDGYNNKIKPLLSKYCIECHGAKKHKADIRFDNIDPDIPHGKHSGMWEDTAEAFNTGEMPPEDEKQPTPEERELLTDWLDKEFKKARLVENPDKAGSVRRLTRNELQYSLEELLKVDAKDAVSRLPEESASTHTGFQNNSKLLMVSGPHLESYLEVILNQIEKIKKIMRYEVTRQEFDFSSFKSDVPMLVDHKGRKYPGYFDNVLEASSGVLIKPGGYLRLRLKRLPVYTFQTKIKTRADESGSFTLSMGFTHAAGRRTKESGLGSVSFKKSDSFQEIVHETKISKLSETLRNSLGQPFFLEITNNSNTDLYINSFELIANINTKLKQALTETSTADADWEGLIAAFIKKAFRRVATLKELTRYKKAFEAYSKTETPILALLDTYKEILCSPKFFYIGTIVKPGDEKEKNFKLAEKLAYFLWSSIPDELLLKDAAAGRLTNETVLKEQIQRMLKHDNAKRFVEQFADQWLNTEKMFNVAVDQNYYNKFKESLKPYMRQETIESVNDVFRNGSSALNLLKADHVFVNGPLADFYGIQGVKSKNRFEKVKVSKESNRGGLLTQGTFLIGNSDGVNSHAILRGVWLSSVILNDPPPEPPNNVPAFNEETIPGFNKLTLKEKLAKHRDNAACMTCHKKIDPFGIPFENFDASGAWRDKVMVITKKLAPVQQVEEEVKKPGKKKSSGKTAKTDTKKKEKGFKSGNKEKNKKPAKPSFLKEYVPIDNSSILPSKTIVKGIAEFKDYLVKYRKDDFAKGLVEKVMAYAYTRDINFRDDEQVEKFHNHFKNNGYSVPKLIEEIVLSEEFKKGAN